MYRDTAYDGTSRTRAVSRGVGDMKTVLWFLIGIAGGFVLAHEAIGQDDTGVPG